MVGERGDGGGAAGGLSPEVEGADGYEGQAERGHTGGADAVPAACCVCARARVRVCVCVSVCGSPAA